MRKIVKMLLGVLALAVLASGCTLYGSGGVMPNTKDFSSYPVNKLFTKVEDEIAVTAYPLTTEEENKKYFDENLLESGVVAVFLEIKNESAKESVKLVAATLDAEIKQKDTTKIVHAQELGAQGLYSILKRDAWGRALATGTITYGLGILPSAATTGSTNEKIKADLEGGKILNFSETKAKESSKGFTSFKVSDEALSSFPLGVTLRLVFNKEGRFIEYNLPL